LPKRRRISLGVLKTIALKRIKVSLFEDDAVQRVVPQDNFEIIAKTENRISEFKALAANG